MPLVHLLALPVTSLDILKTTKVITFNAAAELSLGLATLVIASSAAELAPVETKFDTSTQRASLIFSEELPVGSKATLRLGFEGILTNSMTGYYKSSWEKGTYALTQFEVCVPVAHTCTRWPSLFHPDVVIASEPERLTGGLTQFPFHTNDLSHSWSRLPSPEDLSYSPTLPAISRPGILGTPSL